MVETQWVKLKKKIVCQKVVSAMEKKKKKKKAKKVLEVLGIGKHVAILSTVIKIGIIWKNDIWAKTCSQWGG